MPRLFRFLPARPTAWALNTLLIVLAVVVALIGVRLPLAEQAVRDGARLQGAPVPDLNVTYLHPDGVVLREVAVPALAWRADRIAVDLTPSWQWSRWLRRVAVDGLDATVDFTAERPFGGLAGVGGGPPTTSAETDVGRVRLPSVAVSDATIRLIGREREATLRFDGRVDRGESGDVAAAVQGAATTPAGTLAINIAAHGLPGEPRITASVNGPVDLAALPALPGAPVQVASGTARIALELDSSLPSLTAIASPADLAGGTARGTLAVDARDLALPPLAPSAAASMTLRADMNDQTMKLGLAEPLTITADRIAPDGLAALGLTGAAAELAGRARDVTLAPSDSGGALLTLNRSGGGWRMDGGGRVRVGFADDGQAKIRTDVTGELGSNGTPKTVTAERLTISASNLALADQALRTATFDGRMAWDGKTLTVPGRLEAAMAAIRAGGQHVRDVSASAPIRLTYAPDALTVTTTDTAQLSLPGKLAVGPIATGGVDVRIPSAELRRTGDGLAAEAAIAPGPLTLSHEGVLDGAEIAPGTVRVQLDGSGLDANLPNGRIALPSLGVRADSIALDVQLGQQDDPVGSVAIGKLSDTREPSRFAPIALEAVLRKAANQLTAAGTIRLIDLGVATPFAGRHDLGTGEGTLRLSETEIAFGQDGLQPRAISPRLGLLSRVSGRVTLESTLDWTPARVATPAQISLDGLAFETPTGSFEGVNGTIRMTSLSPPISAPDQTVTADKVVVGVPLTDVEATVSIVQDTGDTAFRIARARGLLADGEIFVEDATYRVAAKRNDVTVRINGLSLAKLIEQLDVSGVSAEGRLSGAIPVAITTQGVAVNDGQLAAESNGVLRVQLEQTGEALKQKNRAVRLMVQALENFQYDKLALTVNRKPEAGLSMRVEMRGKNPDVLDGYPFAFNISLSGDLEPIVLALQKGRRLTTDLLQRALEADKQGE